MRGPVSQVTKADSTRENYAGIYRFYKTYISPVGGDRCPMYPSCSTYSKQAFSQYGFITGFILTADRLTRCGNDLYLYKKFISNGIEYAEDHVKDNVVNSRK